MLPAVWPLNWCEGQLIPGRDKMGKSGKWTNGSSMVMVYAGQDTQYFKENELCLRHRN